jgi:hypothetical protein
VVAVEMAMICSLPVGPLVHVLNHLSTIDFSKLDVALCNTNHRPQFLNYIGQGSSQVYLEDEGPARGDDFISWISLRNISIKFFTGGRHDCFTDVSVSKIVVNKLCWIRLQSLNLVSSHLPSKSLMDLGRCFPNLLKLDIYCPEDEFLFQIAASCPSLQSLSICSGGSFTNASIQRIFECCTQLKSFSLNDNHDITDLTTPEAINFPLGLQKVDISTCYYMSGYSIVKIIETCKGLTSLDISDIGDEEDEPEDQVMTDDLVIRIAECCSGLLSLGLAGLELVTDFSVVQIAENCTQLRCLNLSESKGITDCAVSKIVECCHQLESLHLPGHHEFTDDAFSELSKESLPNLKKLVLNSSLISDDTIILIAECCPKMIHLNLGGCRRITDAGMIQVAQYCRDLEELNLTFCRTITDKSMEKIGEYCKKLTSLDINECQSISSIGIKSLAVKCLTLEKLDLTYNRHVDFSTVESVINSCQRLQLIDVYSCVNVSKEGVKRLKEKFHDRNVVIRDTRGILDIRVEEVCCYC